MATVVPAYNKVSEVARLLIGLADDPRDVQTNTDDGFVFLVPEALYEKYLNAITDPDPGPTNAEQAQRRPGRPRKAAKAAEPDDSDTDTKEGDK